MNDTRFPAVVVTLLLVTTGVAMTGVGASLPADPSDAARTNQVDAGAACGYASLYDRTIDSVVAIRTGDGLGSGFAYRVADDGSAFFVTNAHVVGEASNVQVQFAREESRMGTVVGNDTFSDLAVVRVDDTPDYVDPLPVADEPPQHGEKVAAVGNPFGLEGTITHGIVSGTNRSMPTTLGFTIPDVVQTDAPINPGNSGGPLLSCDGTVIGVNTAGITASEAENIGFSVSASAVRTVVPELIDDGEFEHTFLGIGTARATPQLLEANGFDATGGVYVHEVYADAPANGTLQGTTETVLVDGEQVPVGGDLIVAIDGQSVGSNEALASYLFTETRPGDEVTLTVLRDGDQQNVTVTLGERPSPEDADRS
ncbi:trypsin-like peptidase domain-containing protein [Haloarculaceae archaeon H-GB2-1]|nr:trypsin-like peptidase domain-containing protein [Haloarculaceae archaeon H-GB1-1]MEA5387857.1 trypsin-like peptidase domain-containing protein [Haloarculaceae archaeon H-GB11]MEA5409355.1 trypsin-like peptidase domain-containing protein [Haloarculaceae archaeon H-GB2-1]